MSPNAIATLIQAIIAILTVVVAAIVGTAKAREVAHSKYVETIDELKRISDVKQEMVSVRDAKIHDLEQKTFELTGQVGRLEGFNRRLIEDQMVDDQYRDVLIQLLVKHKIPIPPREIS